MSFTVSFYGDKSTLDSYFMPPIYLGRDYELALLSFDSWNSLPNIDNHNNKFYYGEGQVIEIPTGSYEITDLEQYLEKKLQEVGTVPTDLTGIMGDKVIELKANLQTQQSELTCRYKVDFEKDNSLGPLLGFEKKIVLPFEKHVSTKPVHIIDVNIIRVQCNITEGAYTNGCETHAIYEFPITVPVGYKMSEVPRTLIYYPVIGRTIDKIVLQITDEKGRLLNFREEKINVRLHLKPCL